VYILLLKAYIFQQKNAPISSPNIPCIVARTLSTLIIDWPDRMDEHAVSEARQHTSNWQCFSLKVRVCAQTNWTRLFHFCLLSLSFQARVVKLRRAVHLSPDGGALGWPLHPSIPLGFHRAPHQLLLGPRHQRHTHLQTTVAQPVEGGIPNIVRHLAVLYANCSRGKRRRQTVFETKQSSLSKCES
jgi:hypothetical protein